MSINITSRERYIARVAAQRGLDPKAVLAIIAHEGGSGRVGDGGHAFGPFQLNDAGGVLTNAPASHHSNAWAWSNAGIGYALDGIQRVAQGLHGRAAVTAIASRFERPADIQGEIQDAMAHYGSGVGSGVVQGGGLGGGGKIPAGSVQSGGTRFDRKLFKQQVGMSLLQAGVAEAQGQQAPDLMQTIQDARKAATIPVATSGPNAGQPSLGGNTLGGGAGAKAVALAAKQLGQPYVWGGTGNGGFDCSGLVQWAYGHMGVKLPRTAAEQGKVGRAVGYGAMKPGDLLVENNGDHVVMYAGNGRVIEAPHTGDHVKYAPLSWFPQGGYHARRIVG